MGIEIQVHGLKLQYDARPVLDGVEFRVRPGDLLALLGSNGAGKSTLLRCMSKVLEPTKGRVYLGSEELDRINTGELARHMAVVPQETRADFDFTVEDVVQMGRFPYLGRFRKEGRKDREKVLEAMEMTGVSHLARRPVTSLSGGEKQRVMLARAVCQEPEVLLLDEPTANLDIGYQQSLLEMAERLNREKGVTVIAAIHDINLAVLHFHRFLLLSSGQVQAAGPAEEVITPENIRKSYGVSAQTYRHPLHGALQVSVEKEFSPAGGNNRGTRLHVIGGGEEAVPVLNLLLQEGYRLSLGPVTTQDSGYRLARFHQLPLVEVPPFSPITDALHHTHLELARRAEAVVMPPITFGEGNLANLEAVEQLLDEGKPVYLVDAPATSERDYTGGRAAGIVRRLVEKGAFAVETVENLLQVLLQARQI